MIAVRNCTILGVNRERQITLRFSNERRASEMDIGFDKPLGYEYQTHYGENLY